MDDIDRMFRAFSDRTRLRLLHLLRLGERCVGDLVVALDLPQPTVSRHLAYLRRAGLVAARRTGSWAFYRLAEPRGRFHRTLLGCLGSCFSEVPELRADQARAADPACCASGEGCTR